MCLYFTVYILILSVFYRVEVIFRIQESLRSKRGGEAVALFRAARYTKLI